VGKMAHASKQARYLKTHPNMSQSLKTSTSIW